MKNNFFSNLSNNISSLDNNKKDKMVKIEFNNLDYLNGVFCDDEDVNFFLREKTAQLFQLQANSSLELGKIFCEAAKKLSGDNHYNGLYEKWLSEIGFNKMTALRHRRRYELFLQVEKTHSKKIISVMPVRLLSDVIKSENKEEILNSIEKDEKITVNQIKELIILKEPCLEKDMTSEEEFFKELSSLKKINIKKMDINKTKKLKDELEKILKEITFVLENV